MCPSPRPSFSTSTASFWIAKRPNTNHTGESTSAAASRADRRRVVRRDRHLERHDQQWFTRLRERSTGAPARDAYFAERRRIFEEIVPVDPMRGVRGLLTTLRGAGIPAAIASSAPARWVVGAVERLGIHPLFDAVVTGDEVAHRKPAPDVYLEAARRLRRGNAARWTSPSRTPAPASPPPAPPG